MGRERGGHGSLLRAPEVRGVFCLSEDGHRVFFEDPRYLLGLGRGWHRQPSIPSSGGREVGVRENEGGFAGVWYAPCGRGDSAGSG